MTLPQALASLADLVPPESAMRELVLRMEGKPPAPYVEVVEALPNPALQALAWLYLDMLEPAHEICQSMDGSVGAHLHAIVHRREGDYGNALYWYRQADLSDGMGAQLTRDVAAGDRSETAIERQREEWAALAKQVAA